MMSFKMFMAQLRLKTMDRKRMLLIALAVVVVLALAVKVLSSDPLPTKHLLPPPPQLLPPKSRLKFEKEPPNITEDSDFDGWF